MAKVTGPTTTIPVHLQRLEAKIFASDSESDSEDPDVHFTVVKRTSSAVVDQEPSLGGDVLFTIDRTKTGPSAKEQLGKHVSMADQVVGDDKSKAAPDHRQRRKALLSQAEIKQKIASFSKPTSQFNVEDIQVPSIDFSSVKTMVKQKPKLRAEDVQLLKNAVVGDGFEQKHAVPQYSESKRRVQKQNKDERDKSKGKNWFDMKAPEMTDELKDDIEAMQMRHIFDETNKYRKNDRKETPKFFQIATVQDSPLDFYHSRVPKKERKRTIVDELLADAEFKSKNKKMYAKVEEKMKRKLRNKGVRHKKRGRK